MVIDTSAIAAILFGDADGDRYLDAILSREDSLNISAATLVEVAMVIEGRLGPDGAADFKLFVGSSGMSLVPVDQVQAGLAVTAWRRFGKGRHQAALNLGDCFAYALARALDEPLLFKGVDFAQTDVRAVLPG